MTIDHHRLTAPPLAMDGVRTPSRRGVLAAGATLVLAPWLLPCRMAWAAPTIGKPAPAFAVADSHGATRTLQEFQGRLVVLEWTNHECPYVRKHYGASHI